MTASTATVIPEFVPLETPIAYIPISGSVGELCVTQMPDTRIFASYISSGTVKGHIFNSVQDILANSVFTAAAGTTLFTPGSFLLHQSCFNVAGEIFLHIKHNPGNDSRVDLYKATNSSNPLAGFSHYATVVTYPGHSATNNTEGCCGIPLVLGSGRWVMTTPENGGFFEYAPDHFGIVTSDDNGLSWTTRLNVGWYLVGGSYMDYMSKNIGVLPDGRLWAFGDGLGDPYFAVSSNSGTSWSDASDLAYFPVASNGVTSYAVGVSNGSGQAIRPIDNTPAVGAGIVTLSIPTATPSFVAVWMEAAGVMLYAQANKITGASGGWITGSVGMA